MNCLLCRRSAENSDLCRYHSAAKDELKRGYERWREAYSGMSWIEYLKRVKQSRYTGEWVKEVADITESEGVD